MYHAGDCSPNIKGHSFGGTSERISATDSRKRLYGSRQPRLGFSENDLHSIASTEAKRVPGITPGFSTTRFQIIVRLAKWLCYHCRLSIMIALMPALKLFEVTTKSPCRIASVRTVRKQTGYKTYGRY
jgi:hypothetical protein